MTEGDDDGCSGFFAADETSFLDCSSFSKSGVFSGDRAGAGTLTEGKGFSSGALIVGPGAVSARGGDDEEDFAERTSAFGCCC